MSQTRATRRARPPSPWVPGCLGCLPLLFAICPFGLSVYLLVSARAVVGPTTLERAMDPARVAARSFVELPATPDPDSLLFVVGRNSADAIFGVAENPRLLIYCPADEACMREVKRFRKDPYARPDEAGRANLAQRRSYPGQLFDGDDVGGIGGAGVPELLVRQAAMVERGQKGPESVRLLVVGRSPADLKADSALGTACCALPLVLLACLFWAVALFRAMRR
jgi:hypothetical protein